MYTTNTNNNFFMRNLSKSKVKESVKANNRKLLIDYPPETEANLKHQQSNWMRRHGERPTLNALAAELLKTATL